MKSSLFLSIPENVNVLSTPYWIPKIHKSPIGTKFIITSKECVIKPLGKNTTAAFKLCKSVERYLSK